MKKSLLLCVAALAISATVASAAGVNLAWNDCGGPGNKTFACTANTGNNFLFGSFVAPAGVSAMTANEIVIDLQSQSGVIPQWWEFKNAGTCRSTALSISFDGTTAVGGLCADYWAGQGAGGIGAYQNINAGRRRIVAVGAVPPSAAGPVDADAEYFSFRLGISNVKSSGTGNCGGCLEPVCLVLNTIKLTQPVGVGDFALSNPANSNFATWQSGFSADGGCPAATPTRSTTWGSVKALYR